MKITKEMTFELNAELSAMGYPFRYKYREDTFNPAIEITLPNMNGVDSYIINATGDFLEWLEFWFKSKGIELSCNNNGSILWSKEV